MTSGPKIAIINRFAPPDPAITGASALELAEVLQEALPQAVVRLFATTSNYGSGVARSTSPGTRVDIHRLKGARGKQGIARLYASLLDGWRLANAATRWADIVISLTDPPLLASWLGGARLLRRFRWAEWTMDMFPEAFAAAGMANARGLLVRGLRQQLSLSRPDLYLALGSRQRDAVLAWRKANEPSLVLPCGIVPPMAPETPAPPWKANEQRVILAYAGNIGEAHCAAALVRLVRLADPNRFAFVMALYGNQADYVKAALAETPHVTWTDRLNHTELVHADVHLASLRPEWSHVCVPSKAVSSICLGRPVLFIGARSSDTWDLTDGAGWCVPVVGKDDAEPETLQRVLLEVGDPAILAGRKRAATVRGDELRRLQRDAFQQLIGWCHEAPARGGAGAKATSRRLSANPA
jgi:hypothetical protein